MLQLKKQLLIICSIIGVLLAGFQFPIYAETTPPDYSSSTSIITSAALDQYFYDNYELLPYIESDGFQYINTGYLDSSDLLISCKVSQILNDSTSWFAYTGSYPGHTIRYTKSGDNVIFSFYNRTDAFRYVFNSYDIYDLKIDKNLAYINNNLIHTFTYESFTGSDIYIFGFNNGNTVSSQASFKLYRFSIYDYAAAEGEGALVRDYYPARSKSGGVIGLYDAVSKTFVTTSGSVPFASPTGDPVNLSLGAYITQFLSGSLSWIGAIFVGINEMPIIWVFIAIALAGVMFRWARRIVHF